MLKMRWRPDPTSGSLDLSPFSPDEADLRSAARPIAEAFWRSATDDEWLTPAFRALAEQMLTKVRG